MFNIEQVKDFWNHHPLCSEGIDAELGSEDFFQKYNQLREENEPLDFSYDLHEYPSFQGKKVLDIGCGNGYILAEYAKHGAEVYGVDISDTSVELTKKRFTIYGLNFNGGGVKTENAEHLPFSDHMFDCVVSMGVLHHTPNTQQAINEAYRVLKPNGRMIMMFYHKNSLLNKWNFNVLRYIHPKYFGMSKQELVNSVDGFDNPKGDIYSHQELAVMMKQFRHLFMFNRLV